MKVNVRAWFREVWPRPSNRRAVVAGYAGLKADPHLLADIALRGRVWSTIEVRDKNGMVDVPATMMQFGRRELALEILELAQMPPDQLWSLIERPDLTAVQGDKK